MTATYGLSGATVRPFRPGMVVKRHLSDAQRTQRQGEWIRAQASRHLPLVYAIVENGYVMEELDDVPVHEVDESDVLTILHDFWEGDAQVESVFLHHELQAKIHYNLSAEKRIGPDLYKSVMQRVSHLGSTLVHVTGVRAHGDPTAENVMRRPGSDEYVLIDPLPPTHAVPARPEVDVGKMLQSALGWEMIKGEGASSWRVDDILTAVSDVHVAERAKCWAVIHLARALPYTGSPVLTERLVDLMQRAVTDL